MGPLSLRLILRLRVLWRPCCCDSLELYLWIRISLLALICLIVCLIIFWSSLLRCRSRIHARAGCAILFFECLNLIVDLGMIVGCPACHRWRNPALMPTQEPPTDSHTKCHTAGAELCNRPPRQMRQMPFSPEELRAVTLLFWTCFAWASLLILAEGLRLF